MSDLTLALLDPENSTNVRANGGWLHGLLSTLSVLAPWAMAPLAARLFLTPIRARRVPHRERAWAEGATAMTLPTSLGALSGWSWGWGPRAVLLVHGWAGRGLQLGALVAPLVERGYRVVTFDAPAHGATPGSTTNMPEMARAVADVIDASGPFEAIVGHSLGGTAVAWALRHRGAETRRLVAISSPSRMANILARFGEITGFTGEVLERMRRILESRLPFSLDDLHPVHLAEGQRAELLVIHDQDDREVAWEDGAALAMAWRGRFLRTEGLGHRRILRDEAVVREVVDFVAG